MTFVTLAAPFSEPAEIYTGGTISATRLLEWPWLRLLTAQMAGALDPAGPHATANVWYQAQRGDLAALDDRLAELGRLPQGWLDGEGEAPEPASLRSARAMLMQMVTLGTQRPRVYPTPEGGVQAEWTTGSREISLTFEPGGAVTAAAINTASGAEEELEDGDAEQLARFVLRAI